jgi:anti-sigma B factor antagonist
MIVDLTDVDFIDSTGLATLVIGMKLCRQYDGEFSLCGMHAPVHTIFELTRLDRVFMIAATREKAIASIHERQRG